MLQEFQNGQKDMNEVVRQVISFFLINIQIVTLFQGHDDLIKQFVMFLPQEYHYHATVFLMA